MVFVIFTCIIFELLCQHFRDALHCFALCYGDKLKGIVKVNIHNVKDKIKCLYCDAIILHICCRSHE